MYLRLHRAKFIEVAPIKYLQDIIYMPTAFDGIKVTGSMRIYYRKVKDEKDGDRKYVIDKKTGKYYRLHERNGDYLDWPSNTKKDILYNIVTSEGSFLGIIKPEDNLNGHIRIEYIQLSILYDYNHLIIDNVIEKYVINDISQIILNYLF